MSHLTPLHVAVIGSGPAGTTVACLLARNGHRPGVEWDRVGIMQFRQPHLLRAVGMQVLADRVPGLRQALVEAAEGTPAAPGAVGDLRLRRPLIDQVMWEYTSAQPGVTRRTGHARDVVVEGARVIGVLLDGEPLAADLVVDATGKSGRFAASYRPEFEGGDCGLAYVSRLFRLRAGAAPGPLNGGPGYVGDHRGFQNLIFVHDHGTFTVLLVRGSHDEELARLRDEAVFMRAVASIPAAAAWTEPERSEPIGPVRPGAGLVNQYRPQARGVVGLLSIGDSTCATNPTAARGISLGIRAAAALADVVDNHPPAGWAGALDEWCLGNLRPWFTDHVEFDRVTAKLWAGRPITTEDPMSWALVAEAAGVRPEFGRVLGPFFGMVALPESIDPLRDEVREMVRAGWQPAARTAPSRDDLVAVIRG